MDGDGTPSGEYAKEAAPSGGVLAEEVNGVLIRPATPRAQYNPSMGFFRFRRSFRLLPGVRINLGKRSASVSVGVRAAHVTFGGPQGTRATVGLPGTGLSYTEVSKPRQDEEAPVQTSTMPPSRGRRWLWTLPIAVLALIVWVVTR